MLELINAYEKMTAANGPDRDKVVAECIQKIYDLHKENTWIIGYLKPMPNRILVNKDLKNVPETVKMADEFRFSGNARPEQFWWDK